MATVTLLSYTHEPQKLIAAAAKLCYSPVGVQELMDGLTPEKVDKFVSMLESIGHESPMEHVTFTFAIEGVSRSFLAQITRHRIASYSVQSQRYVKEMDFSYVTPPQIAQNEQANAAFQECMRVCGQYYEQITALLKEGYVKENLASGMDEKKASSRRKNAPLRTPALYCQTACDTKMIVTMNVRSLFNFFAHRCCNRAQWEIREVADKMLALVYEKAPVLFAHAGAPCVRGVCPEGKMSCGRMKEMQEHMRAIKQQVDERRQ